MRVVRIRPLTLAVLSSLATIAIVFALIAGRVVRDDERRLLQKQTGEVGALLTNSFSGVSASLRSLSTVADADDPTARAFLQSAAPLVVGQTRAIILFRVEGTLLRRVAIVGDGIGEGDLSGSRAALVRRAGAEPGLVTGVISDGPRRRVGLARGPWPSRSGWIVYQESAIDPNNPDQPTTGRPFRELDVAMYASETPRSDRLVLATTRNVPLRGVVSMVTVQVGVDHWLLVASSPRPLVGSFASFAPWILLIVGLAAALLAGLVVEVISRRRDFALELVDEHTAALRATVTELESAQAELVRHAFSDDLTGLANRPLFLNRLENALARASRGTASPLVMFLDLDRFKWVNDSLGHEVGDQLLVAVAGRLAAAVRPGDSVARIGGDEFVILCEGPADFTMGRGLAERLQRAITPPFDLDGRILRATMSIGLALARPDGTTSAEEQVRDADLAMYQAKELGRDRIAIFDERMRRSAVIRHETETALRRAVDNREFVVHYQPVVSIAAGDVVGVEALVRWASPDGVLVMPDDFIPLAEDTGLIAALGAQVLSDACAQVAEWNRDRGRNGDDRPALRLSVNLSTRQLVESELPRLVASTLVASGLPPSLLCLEITESTLMEGDTAHAALVDLKALGVTLVVDDFGTGYSSLIYLRRFPVDVLKLDKSFVAGLGDNPEDTAIVTGVIGLAKGLGLRTVAEGIETPNQLEQLAVLGCELGQGYHWSRALAAGDFADWLVAFDARRLPGSEGLSSHPRPTRVLIVDDQPAMRDVVRLALSIDGECEIVGEAGNGAEAIELARALRPDLVVLDLQMPVMGGAEALPRILAVSPETRVVVLTAHELIQPDGALEGAVRCYDKTTGLEALVVELRTLVGALGAVDA